jgi:pentatricopeptide repeat protein
MFLGRKLVTMYGKCDSVVDACCYLDEMQEKNAVSWGSIISVYAEHGHCEEALNMFRQIHYYTSFQPNQLTFDDVLVACADLETLEHCREIHGDIIQSG